MSAAVVLLVVLFLEDFGAAAAAVRNSPSEPATIAPSCPQECLCLSQIQVGTARNGLKLNDIRALGKCCLIVVLLQIQSPISALLLHVVGDIAVVMV
jgi:hypothetical protein